MRSSMFISSSKLNTQDQLSATAYSKSFSSKDQLFNLIKYRCQLTGNCFSNRTVMHRDFEKKIGKKCARSTFYLYLAELEESGQIVRERIGKRFIIWTAETFSNRIEWLEKFPIKYIGKKKILAYTDPKMAQILHTKILVKDPMYFYAPETKNRTVNRTVPPGEKALFNKENKLYEEVVYIPKPKVKAKRVAPLRPMTTPLFKRNVDKETIPIEVRRQLVETYTLEKVDKFEANALKYMILSVAPGKRNFQFYERGLEAITREYCEQDQKITAHRKEVAEKKEELKKKVPSIEEKVQERRSQLKNNPFVLQYVYESKDKTGFFLRENMFSREEYNSFSRQGMSYDDNNAETANSYKIKFENLEKELRYVKRKQSGFF